MPKSKKREEAVIMPKGAKRCSDCSLVRVKEEFKKGSEICDVCTKTRKTIKSRVLVKKGSKRPKFDSQAIAENKFSKSATEFLDEIGWTVMVIGNIRIEKRNLDRKYKFELVIDFTGKKLNAK